MIRLSGPLAEVKAASKVLRKRGYVALRLVDRKAIGQEADCTSMTGRLTVNGKPVPAYYTVLELEYPE